MWCVLKLEHGGFYLLDMALPESPTIKARLSGVTLDVAMLDQPPELTSIDLWQVNDGHFSVQQTAVEAMEPHDDGR